MFLEFFAYTPDVAPYDFSLFLQTKKTLERRNIHNRTRYKGSTRSANSSLCFKERQRRFHEPKFILVRWNLVERLTFRRYIWQTHSGWQSDRRTYTICMLASEKLLMFLLTPFKYVCDFQTENCILMMKIVPAARASLLILATSQTPEFSRSLRWSFDHPDPFRTFCSALHTRLVVLLRDG